MYALFYEDSKDLIGIYRSKPQAMAIARVISSERKRPLVCYFNKPTGGTTTCFKFEAGNQTFDGGCCPSTWAKSAMETVTQGKSADALLT